MSGAKSKRTRREGFEFEGTSVDAGTVHHFEVRVARLPAGSWATMPTTVVHGRKPGPVVWVSAAIHGDELNGVAIIRDVLAKLDPKELAGTVIAVPIVNVFGVTIESRYLPDRRDLNRSFPGSKRGSLAGRLAHLFFERVVMRCDFGIDFHTGSGGRDNLAQVRCDLDDETTRRYGFAFAPPILMHAALRDGSLRAAASERDIPVLMYEGGEALRFDEDAIVAGVAGTMRVLRAASMLADAPIAPSIPPIVSRKSRWVRATRSGFCHMRVDRGDHVEKGECVATIVDGIGKREVHIKATAAGIVVGVLRTAAVHRGEALLHIATIDEALSMG